MSGSGGSSRRCGARGVARPGKGCPFRDPRQWSTSVCGQAIPGEQEHYATLQMMHLGEGSARGRPHFRHRNTLRSQSRN